MPASVIIFLFSSIAIAVLIFLLQSPLSISIWFPLYFLILFEEKQYLGKENLKVISLLTKFNVIDVISVLFCHPSNMATFCPIHSVFIKTRTNSRMVRLLMDTSTYLHQDVGYGMPSQTTRAQDMQGNFITPKYYRHVIINISQHKIFGMAALPFLCRDPFFHQNIKA